MRRRSAVPRRAGARFLGLSLIHSRLSLGLRLFPLIGASAALYFAVLMLLRVDEVKALLALARRKLGLAAG